MRDFRTTLTGLLLGIVALRLVSMAVVPMLDPTEPRYAEIARLMAESGDWVTPWLSPGVPFWGKPPLSFWAQAGSMQLLGVSDFAARLPSWLAMLGVIALTIGFGRWLGDRTLGLLAGVILASSALAFSSSGAVFTDPFLALGTTLSIIAAARTVAGSAPAWRWLFFVGLAVGLLAKGPVAVVLVALPLVAWGAWTGRLGQLAAALPWLRGGLLTAALVVPWYVLAEARTPGFLQYFLVGEHLGRFVDPGWEGNRYGSAHEEPLGAIWLLLAGAAFPWTLVAVALLLSRRLRQVIQDASPTLRQGDTRLLWTAGLAPAVFFTPAGNILWTYLLPALPFLSLLAARALQPALDSPRLRAMVASLALLAPLVVTGYGLYLTRAPETVKSARPIFEAAARDSGAGPERVYFVGRPPHSARYYSRGTARSIAPDRLGDLGGLADGRPLYLAVRNRHLESLSPLLPGATIEFKGARHTLLRLDDPTRLAEASRPHLD
jgi:4-amino-4-deoxy-L-arabinose transferase-like glycosyltransferase